MLSCRSSAKINLTLDILQVRPDGYHELQSVVHTIGWWDTLQFEPNASGTFTLHCNISELQGDDNLCLKAARRWLQAVRDSGAATQWNGTAITLHKNIPSGAGLGGGSGNAAATLLALDSLYDSRLPAAVLRELAASLGADVPLFMRGGCMLMEGIGEKLTPLPDLHGWTVVVQPPQRISTPAAYRAWDALQKPSAHRPPQRCSEQSRSEQLCSVLESTLNTPQSSRHLTPVAQELHNDLRCAAQELGVDVQRILDNLQQCGAVGAEMTGSGSAVFGLFPGEETACQAAAAMQERIRREYGVATTGWRVHAAPFTNSGVEFRQH